MWSILTKQLSLEFHTIPTLNDSVYFNHSIMQEFPMKDTGVSGLIRVNIVYLSGLKSIYAQLAEVTTVYTRTRAHRVRNVIQFLYWFRHLLLLYEFTGSGKVLWVGDRWITEKVCVSEDGWDGERKRQKEAQQPLKSFGKRYSSFKGDFLKGVLKYFRPILIHLICSTQSFSRSSNFSVSLDVTMNSKHLR